MHNSFERGDPQGRSKAYFGTLLTEVLEGQLPTTPREDYGGTICTTVSCLDQALHRAARDGRHEQNFIALLERVHLSAEEANVFFIYVDVEEAPNLSLVVAQVRLQFGKFLVEHREQFPEIRRGAGDRTYARGVAAKRGRNLYGDRHVYASTVSASAITPGTSEGLSVCCRYCSNSVNFGAIGRSVW